MSARDRIDEIVSDVRRDDEDVLPALSPGQGSDHRPEPDLDEVVRKARDEGGRYSRRPF